MGGTETPIGPSAPIAVIGAGTMGAGIVNRGARPYYAEALRLAEEQIAEPATIDAMLTQGGGSGWARSR